MVEDPPESYCIAGGQYTDHLNTFLAEDIDQGVITTYSCPDEWTYNDGTGVCDSGRLVADIESILCPNEIPPLTEEEGRAGAQAYSAMCDLTWSKCEYEGLTYRLTSGTATVVKLPDVDVKYLFRSTDVVGWCEPLELAIVADEAGTALTSPASDIFAIVDGKMQLTISTPATVAGEHEVFIQAKPIENLLATYVYRPFKLTLLGPRAAACN